MLKEDRTPSKIEKLVAETKAHLNGLGIETNGKTQTEVLDMARAERNKPRKRIERAPQAIVESEG